MSTRISDTVERVWNVFPQEQCTDAIWYSGWMPCFMSCLLGRFFQRTRLSAGRRLRDLLQELVVRLRGADLVGEELQRGSRLEGVQHPPELPDERELLGLEQELLLPGAGGLDVDRREQPLLGEGPVQPEIHVPRCLELLEDALVHP